MFDDNKIELSVLVGFILGIVLTLVLWIFVADQVEMNKVQDGYLTYKSKTYTVTLYDTLDRPEKEKDD